jgi:hypothetical protein
MRKVIPLLITILFFVVSTHAQSFWSGSTGADGALDLTSGDRVVQMPESGILNYTTVIIPLGRTLSFKANSRNTPVIMLAQEAVNIRGTISVDAPANNNFCCDGRLPGPGGFYGGNQGPGFGPGAGQSPGANGNWIGPLNLTPIIGGSGGDGRDGFVGIGGGGGGAITIASSTSIMLSAGSVISASGGISDSFNIRGTAGSGGAIRLVANSINVAGSLFACNIWSSHFNQFGPCGVIRLEAPSGALTFTGTASPPAGLFPINPTVVPSALPVLTFVSIGGFSVPSYAGQRFDTYDMLLPNQLTDPISVVVQANNIPVGTQVTVGFVNGSPNGTSTPGTLAGTFESSTATATISNLNRTAVTYLLATATFDPPMGATKFNPKGPNHVAKIRVVASPGGKPKFVFLRSNGTQVNQARVPKRFLEQLGL